MNIETDARPRRARWVRVARILVFVLIPIGLCSLWDFVEARRLSGIVRDIRRRGEPVTTLRPQTRLEDLPQNAARYYDAAAALLDQRALYDGPENITQSLRYGRGDRAATLERVRRWLAQNAEAERLLGLATDAEFSGFAPGTEYNYRTSRMIGLATMADLRMLDRSTAGDGAGAARALIMELRVARTGEKTSFGGDLVVFTVERALTEFAGVLQANPGEPALAALAAALAEQDQDGEIKERVLGARAYLIDTFWSVSADWYGRPAIRFSNGALQPSLFLLFRPWFAHRVNNELRGLNAAVGRANEPWPTRASAPEELSMAPVYLLGRRFDHPALMVTQLVARQFHANARRLALVRTAETAVAVERFRLAHGGQLPSRLDELVPAWIAAVPVDPFSGSPVKFVSAPARYAVYSVGVNRKDDGGTSLRPPTPKVGTREQLDLAPDIGIEVALTASPAAESKAGR